MALKDVLKNIFKNLRKDSCFVQQLYIKISYLRNYIIHNPYSGKPVKKYSEHGIVYLLAPSHSNLGDIAIFVKSLEFLRNHSSLPIKTILYSHQCVKKGVVRSLPLYADDVIIIHGGGNMGTIYPAEEYLRQNIVKWFPDNKIISLPQTVWFGNEKKNYILDRAKKIYSFHQNLTIFGRDVPSYDFCKNNFKCDVQLCPDMVLSSLPERTAEYQKNKKVLLCLRKDIESSLDSGFQKEIEKHLSSRGYSFEYWDTDDLSGRNIENKEERIQQVLKYFNQFQFVITDRYHGTILSYISKTPCIGLDNSFGKVKNGFVWFKVCNYMFYADSFEKLQNSIQEIEELNSFQINRNLILEFDVLKKMIDEKNEIREIYSKRIKNNINDSFYADGVSWEGKIKNLRTYAEIIVRFILNKPTEYLTLGKQKEKLKQKSNDNPLLMNSLKVICEYGDNNTHTEATAAATEEDFNNAVDAVYGMYAYLFVSYLKKYGLNGSDRTLSIFSLLPPIIRYKSLNYLWENEYQDSVLADKLNLAILKTFGIDKSKEWINENADLLKQLPCVSEVAKQDLIQKVGKQVATKILISGPQSMYDVCISKVSELSVPIEKYGVLYSTYEEAVSFYKTKMQELKTIKPFSKEEIELEEIMNFCFEGRKAIFNGKDSSLYCLSELKVISRGTDE